MKEIINLLNNDNESSLINPNFIYKTFAEELFYGKIVFFLEARDRV